MLYKTPVIFVIENNGYAMGTSVSRSSNVEDLSTLGESYDMPSFAVYAMNVEAVHGGRSCQESQKRRWPYPA